MRIAICSDAKNEADDQFAIAHALLTPSFDVRGMVAQHFGSPGSMEASFREIEHIRSLIPSANHVPVLHGEPDMLGPIDALPDCEPSVKDFMSEGVRFLIEEALHPDPRPLYVLCMGPLTDVAVALRARPEIATRMTVIWVGGGRYPSGSHEANLAHDLVAAREVFATCVPLWQIPSKAYKTLAVPVAQLETEVRPRGALGAYLYDQLLTFMEQNIDTKPWINPESWVLGDQAAVGVLLAEQKECYDEIPAPQLDDGYRYLPAIDNSRTIRVYHDLNTRLVLDDLFAKLKLHAQ